MSEFSEASRRARGGRRAAPRRAAGLIVLLAASPLLSACEREKRDVRLDPPLESALDAIALMPNGIAGAPPQVYFALGQPYETNAYALSEGKRLYGGIGCRDCHGNGEGGKGPSLVDGWWIYGPDMVSLVATIRDGRPNGMPAFRERLTTEQIWQVAGYVQTIGAMAPKTAAPGRNDEPQTRPAENRAPASNPALIQPPSR